MPSNDPRVIDPAFVDGVEHVEEGLGRQMTDREKEAARAMIEALNNACAFDLLQMSDLYASNVIQLTREMAMGVEPERLDQIAREAVWMLMVLTRKIAMDASASAAEARAEER